MSTSAESGHIELDGDRIRYASMAYGDWTIPVDDVRVIGEATNQNGPFADDYFLCFVTGRETWYEASFYADGRDAFLTTLGSRLNTELRLNLAGSTDFASRILWPIEAAGSSMFEYRDVPPKTMVGRLLGSMRVAQALSDQVLTALGK